MINPQHLTIPCGTAKLSFLVGRFDRVVATLLNTQPKRGQVILPCTLYDLARIEQDHKLAGVYSKLDFCTTDGMPLVWWFHYKTKNYVERVYGPDILAFVFAKTPKARHCFLCPNKKVIGELKKKLRAYLKLGTIHLELVGDSTDPAERKRLAEIVRSFNPRFVWVGVGSPNQVLLATFLKKELKMPCTFWCVGAAIPFLAGTVVQAPRWMQKNGLEWLFRLTAEPSRLWKRYLVVTPLFLFRLLFARIQSN